MNFVGFKSIFQRKCCLHLQGWNKFTQPSWCIKYVLSNIIINLQHYNVKTSTLHLNKPHQENLQNYVHKCSPFNVALFFNQSQCLDSSNIFLDPYLSISANSQCFYKYNYWLHQQKYIQNTIFFQVCFRISYLLKPCLIKYYSNPLLITVICINISSALKNWEQHTETVSTISAAKCVCVCVCECECECVYSLQKNMRTFNVTVYLSCTLVSEAEWMEQWLWANSGTDFLDTLYL